MVPYSLGREEEARAYVQVSFGVVLIPGLSQAPWYSINSLDESRRNINEDSGLH